MHAGLGGSMQQSLDRVDTYGVTRVVFPWTGLLCFDSPERETNRVPCRAVVERRHYDECVGIEQPGCCQGDGTVSDAAGRGSWSAMVRRDE